MGDRRGRGSPVRRPRHYHRHRRRRVPDRSCPRRRARVGRRVGSRGPRAPASRANRRARGAAPREPSATPNGSAGSRRRRSAPGSRATSTTRPVTRSTSSSSTPAPRGCSASTTRRARGPRSRRSRRSRARRSARSTARPNAARGSVAPASSATWSRRPASPRSTSLAERHRAAGLDVGIHARGDRAAARPGRRPGCVPDPPGGAHQRRPARRRQRRASRSRSEPSALELAVEQPVRPRIAACRGAATGSSACASGPRCSAARSRRAPRTATSACGRACPTAEATHEPTAGARPARRRRRPHARRPAGGALERRRRSRSSARPPTARAAVEAARRLQARRRAHGRTHARSRRHRGHPRDPRRLAARSRSSILTTFEQDDYIFGALSAGASGFLLKRTQPEELIAAIHTVAAGDSLLSPSVTRTGDRAHGRPALRPTLGAGSASTQLTPREREVLELIARGLSNARDRRRLRHRGVDGQDARQAHPHEARRARPRPGGDLRLRERADDAGLAEPRLTSQDRRASSTCPNGGSLPTRVTRV